MYTLRDDTAIVQCAIDVYGRGLVGVWLESLQNWLVNYRQPILQCDVFATFHGLQRKRGSDLRLHQGILVGITRGLGVGRPKPRVQPEHSVGL
jgi:hypothetical protein